MLANKWAVYLFDPTFCGVVYFQTRREARRFKSLLTLPTMQNSGLKGHIDRTGI